MVTPSSVLAMLAQAELVADSPPEITPVLTLLPPLVAIVLAVVTRQVLLSLFCGVWIGCWVLFGGNPVGALLGGLDTYVVDAIADEGHAHILLFSFALAGMVNVIHTTGGIRGLVLLVSRFAKTARSGQVATSVLGMLIFFDDYSNTLIVGNTMRSFTDRVRISREKLSFLVDSTAAPVATIGIISTWTAYQIGLLGDELTKLNLTTQPYLYFLHSLPYAFYSIFMLVFVMLVAVTLRDFGPMRHAEKRCRETGKVLRDGASPLASDRTALRLDATDHEVKEAPARWLNAVVPVSCLLLFTVMSLYYTGVEKLRGAGVENPGLHDIIGNAATYKALLWSGYGAVFVAMIMGVLQGHRIGTLIASWVDGASSLVLAAMILVLAWSISSLCGDLGTADAIVSMTPKALPLGIVPAATFILAGLIALATGTSYGTMAILIPLIFPLTYRLGIHAGLSSAEIEHIGHASLAAILGGSVFGDHCSPISDTTVLSSMSSGADHVDHVRTQFPYATLVAAVSVPAYLLVGFGTPTVLVHLITLTTLAGLFALLTREKKIWPLFRTRLYNPRATFGSARTLPSVESRQTRTSEILDELPMGKCKYENIILFGPPGVGKGAQAEILSRGYDLTHLSTGELIRQAIREKTPLGLKVKEAVEAGKLADDDTVLGIIMDQIDRPELQDGFVMDGFPRTVVQAERLEELMTERGKKIECALFLTAPEETIIERLSGRRVCSECSATYHAEFKRPRIEGVCDSCMGKVVQRHDDNPKVYQKRLGEYRERTTSLVNFYKDSGVMVEVNATQPILEVAREVAKHLDES